MLYKRVFRGSPASAMSGPVLAVLYHIKDVMCHNIYQDALSPEGVVFALSAERHGQRRTSWRTCSSSLGIENLLPTEELIKRRQDM
jgi:hypothetical protein